MSKTVIALYDEMATARRAVEALVDAGFDRSSVSLVANDVSGEYGQQVNSPDDDVNAGEGAGFGAVVGTLVGLGVALIPGIGPVIAAGPLAAALLAGIGAVAGAATGGIVAGLVDFGVPEEHAHYYAEGVRRGGTLVTVHVDQDEWADRAQNILNRYNPVNIDNRSARWRETGWESYDETAEPYSTEEIQRHRQSYGSTTGVTTPSATATATRYQPYSYYEPKFRTDYNTNYAGTGYDYSVYDPAYRYGYNLATDARYDNRTWDDIEPEVHNYWDDTYPNTWDRVKNSIRHAWEDVTGR